MENDDTTEKAAAATETWPAHFPTCCPCPPADATPCHGVLYYLAHHPPQSGDFWCALQWELYPKDDLCDRASLSCWTTPERFGSLRKMPRHRQKVDQKATLGPEHGRMMPTGPNAGAGHRSVWFNAETHQRLETLFAP